MKKHAYEESYEKDCLAMEEAIIPQLNEVDFSENKSYLKFVEEFEAPGFFEKWTDIKDTGDSSLHIEEKLNFGPDDRIIRQLESEAQKMSALKLLMSDYMIEKGLTSELPGLFNMTFQMACYLYPSVIEFLKLNKDLIIKYMGNSPDATFEINCFNIEAGTKNVGIHHQHIFRKGCDPLDYIHDIRNLHITLTEKIDQPLILWEGTGRGFPTGRYIAKYLMENSGREVDRNLLTKALYLNEGGQEFSQAIQYLGAFYLRTAFNRSFCQDHNVKGVYFTDTYKQALVFNPYMMHGSSLLPASNLDRFTLVIRSHSEENTLADCKDGQMKKDTAICLATLFGNQDESIYENILNLGDFGPPSFSAEQLKNGLPELQRHYDASKEYFSKDLYHFNDPAKKEIDAYVGNLGLATLASMGDRSAV